MSKMSLQMIRDELGNIFDSKSSTFYREIWKEKPRDFSEVKVISSEELIDTNLYDRLYREETGLIKTVQMSQEPFLTKRAWSDIRLDKLPIVSGARTFILMENTEEGLEYSLSSYEHNAIPYLGDLNNLEVALFCAEQFKVTTLICDLQSLKRLFNDNLIPSSVESIIVIDSVYDELYETVAKSYKIEAFLSLPETGVLGKINFDKTIVPDSNTHLEVIDEKCVVTKPQLITPLIRYKTEISCKNEESALFVV